MATIPVLQALVLADHVYIDGRSGKKVIAGTFNRLWAPEFPTRLERISFAFICLTNVHGTATIELRYVDLKSNKVLLKFGPVSVTSEDPLGSTEMVVEVPPLPMLHEGVYALEMYSEEERLGALRITAGRRTEGSGQ